MTPRPHSLRYLLNGAFYRLDWIEWGEPDAPPVVCVHGLTRNARDFDELAQGLADRFRVIAPDLPGRGALEWLPAPPLYVPLSYVQALSHLLAVIGQPVRWVGTSLGGICGMLIAAASGQPISRIVLNDVGPFIPKASLMRLREIIAGNPDDFADVGAIEQRLRVANAPFGHLTDAQWHAMAVHSSRELANGRLALNYDPNITKAFADGDLEDIDLWAVWRAVKIPTFVLRGADSELLDASTLARMEESGTKSFTVNGAGHAPAMMDAPTIAVVRGFLEA